MAKNPILMALALIHSTNKEKDTQASIILQLHLCALELITCSADAVRTPSERRTQNSRDSKQLSQAWLCGGPKNGGNRWKRALILPTTARSKWVLIHKYHLGHESIQRCFLPNETLKTPLLASWTAGLCFMESRLDDSCSVRRQFAVIGAKTLPSLTLVSGMCTVRHAHLWRLIVLETHILKLLSGSVSLWPHDIRSPKPVLLAWATTKSSLTPHPTVLYRLSRGSNETVWYTCTHVCMHTHSHIHTHIKNQARLLFM